MLQVSTLATPMTLHFHTEEVLMITLYGQVSTIACTDCIFEAQHFALKDAMLVVR